MPRENSFSDSDGRSLTPDLEDEVTSPVQAAPPMLLPVRTEPLQMNSPTRPDMNALERVISAPPSIHEHPAQARSPKFPMRASASGENNRPQVPPLDRFRSTVRKVIAMRRGSAAMSRPRVGAEPGVDPRRESAFLAYGHIREKCLIEVVDYSSVRSSFGRMTNQEFIRLLADSRASERESWVKVRWINVGGVSWDVISALAIKYDIHPLALEDLLHFRKNARSKADYYSKHLFLRVLCHSLCSDDEAAVLSEASFTGGPRSASPVPMDDGEDSQASWEKEKDAGATAYYQQASSSGVTLRTSTLSSHARRKLNRDIESHPPTTPRLSLLDPKSRKDARNRNLIRELKKGERVNVKIAPICIFLFRDGTVLSIHQDTKLQLTTPITERLRQRDTGLRSTADASLLVQSLLDLVVDQALEVVEEYQSRILKLEQAVLLKPNMKHVRRLHILQGDLILHKRTLEPIKTVIYGLRRYDVDRVAALQEHFDPDVKVQGYMSHKAKIYLADVFDHMEYILTSLDMFAGISDNLINYTFNMSSYEMNEVMRRLTLATIIFLPLTLLTGYFGMNFTRMWSVQNNSDVLFWIIALPVMAVVVPIFMWADIERAWHYLQKRAIAHIVKEKYKQD